MGFKLRRQVRDCLPPGVLTATERSLVLEAADACDDDSREGYPGVEWLAEKADVPESKVGENFNKVGKKWIELRVPLGIGKDGRPYYSRPRKRTTYRFPSVEVLKEAKATRSRGPNKVPGTGGPMATRSRGPEVPQNGGTRSPESGGPSPDRTPQQDPSKNTSRLSPADARLAATEDASTDEQRERGGDFSNQKFKSHEHRILARHGYAEHQADYLIEQITEMFEPYGVGWWITADKNGTLSDRIQEVIADYLAAQRVAQQPA